MNTLSLVIVGHGRMGRAVEAAARDAGHQIVAIVDPISAQATRDSLIGIASVGAEVAIEFSTPSTAEANCRALLGAGLPVICGTTGWNGALKAVEEEATRNDVGLLWSPNFSLGIAIAFRLTTLASRWFAGAGDFSPWLFEAHHSGKKDGPSGTARRLAELIVEHTPGKTTFGPAPAETVIDHDMLPVAWIRAGSIPGEHRIGWDAPEESFELTHRARSRGVFARGALRAAEWIIGQHGPCHFDEFLDEVIFAPRGPSAT